MKNKSIKTINVTGTVGYVVSILLIIAAVSAMVITAIAGAGAIAVADNDISVKVATDIDIKSSGNFLDTLNHFIKIDGVDDLSDLISKDENAADDPAVTFSDKDISEITVKEKDGGLAVNAKAQEKIFSVKRVIACLAVTFCMLGAAAVMLHMLKGLMKAFKTCETPFCENVIKKMTYFARSLVPVYALYMVSNGMWSSLGRGSDFSMSVNLGYVLLIAVVYILVEVFRYGAGLQKESDETL